MDRKIVLLGYASILFLSCVGICFQFVKPVGAAATWTVDDDGPADYSTIQEVKASTEWNIEIMNKEDGELRTVVASALWIEPSSIVYHTISVSVGYRFNVTVFLNADTKVASWQFKLLYNKDHLRATGCWHSGGTPSSPQSQLFEKAGSTTLPLAPYFGSWDVTRDYVLFGESWMMGPFPDADDCPASLAYVEFEVISLPEEGGELTSVLDITTSADTYYQDDAENYYRGIGIDASYTLSSHLHRDIATTDVTPSKHMIRQGHSLSINVTVENQGDVTETFDLSVYAHENLIDTEEVTLPAGNSATITFRWNTTDVAPGNYTLSAYAAVVLGETDTADNMFTDGAVTILAYVHDVAVVSVEPFKTVVGQGYSFNMNVTVENQGDVTETFNVTAYANTTIIETKEITLTNGNSTTVAFTWNTTGCHEYENYTISACAHPLPGETDTADNEFVEGIILIVHVGDVNSDEKVRVDDILAVALQFGSDLGDPNWDPNCDINCDGQVRVDDILVAALEFGWTKP